MDLKSNGKRINSTCHSTTYDFVTMVVIQVFIDQITIIPNILPVSHWFKTKRDIFAKACRNFICIY